MLGARVETDVSMDGQGRAQPGKGISVAPAWRELPAHRIPKRLQPLARKARGGLDRCIWWTGEGAFVESVLIPGLRLMITGPIHGQVEPAEPMPLEKYQELLASTRNYWMPIAEDEGCEARRPKDSP